MDQHEIPESVFKTGTAQIAMLGNWRFEFSPEPTGVRPASIVFVETPTGEPIDLVAWLPGIGEVWWRWLGVGQVLGSDALLRAAWIGSAIEWMPSPASWFESRFWGKRHTACYFQVPAHG